MGVCRSIIMAAASLAGCLNAPPNAIDVPRGADASADEHYLIPSGAPITTAPVGGDGGEPFAATCPDGRFVTGLGGRDSDYGLAAVWARCSLFRVTAAGEIEVVDTVDGEPVLGDPDSVVVEPVDCSPGLIAVGYAGSANWNDVVGHLLLHCAELDWDGSGATVSGPGEDTEVLGAVDDAGSGEGTCDSGQAAAGISGRVGLLVDQFRLDCFGLEAGPGP